MYYLTLDNFRQYRQFQIIQIQILSIDYLKQFQPISDIFREINATSEILRQSRTIRQYMLMEFMNSPLIVNG